jgi:uncharacterized protein YdiU (UPF0061 family)
MDDFHPGRVFSSIDQNGRYAYGNQPAIAHWNLAMLAQAMLPILHEDQEQAVAIAQATVDKFPALFAETYYIGMLRKLGIVDGNEQDQQLLQDFLDLLEKDKLDFTLSFRYLAEISHGELKAELGDSVAELISWPESMEPWLTRWRDRLSKEPGSSEERQEIMLLHNPVFIPRNHLVEAAIRAAQDNNDLSVFHALGDVLAEPFTYKAELSKYATPPKPEEVVTKTFCGT